MPMSLKNFTIISVPRTVKRTLFGKISNTSPKKRETSIEKRNNKNKRCKDTSDFSASEVNFVHKLVKFSAHMQSIIFSVFRTKDISPNAIFPSMLELIKVAITRMHLEAPLPSNVAINPLNSFDFFIVLI